MRVLKVQGTKLAIMLSTKISLVNTYTNKKPNPHAADWAQYISDIILLS